MRPFSRKIISNKTCCTFSYFCTALQDRVAKLFNKDAALFVPTGTMGNLISGQCYKSLLQHLHASVRLKPALLSMMKEKGG